MLYKKLWLNLWVFAVTTFAVVWIEMQNYNLFLYLPSSYFHNSVE